MHELALVEGVVSAVLDLMHKKGGRVISFKVSIGELTHFDRTSIKNLLDDLIKGTELAEARVIVEDEKAVVRCLYCNSKWGFHELIELLSDEEKEIIHFMPELLNSFSKCPACGKTSFEIESGKSIRLVEVEMSN